MAKLLYHRLPLTSFRPRSYSVLPYAHALRTFHRITVGASVSPIHEKKRAVLRRHHPGGRPAGLRGDLLSRGPSHSSFEQARRAGQEPDRECQELEGRRQARASGRRAAETHCRLAPERADPSSLLAPGADPHRPEEPGRSQGVLPTSPAGVSDLRIGATGAAQTDRNPDGDRAYGRSVSPAAGGQGSDVGSLPEAHDPQTARSGLSPQQRLPAG